MKRLLILSDSLALPRKEPEEVKLEDTWPFLLKEKLGVQIIQSSIGGATSEDLLNQVFYYRSLDFDLVILQCGVVDLSPRAFLRHEISLFKRYRFSRLILKRITSNKKVVKEIRRVRKVSYTSVKQFRKNLSAIQKNFQAKVYGITVPGNLKNYDAIVPGITEQIRMYNNVIREIFQENTIDISGFSYDELMADFHHLNRVGHLRLMEAIRAQLITNNVIK